MRLPGRRRSAAAEQRVTCGCCGRELPVTAVHELGGTPGVYVCRRCALGIAARIGRRQPIASPGLADGPAGAGEHRSGRTPRWTHDGSPLCDFAWLAAALAPAPSVFATMAHGHAGRSYRGQRPDR